MSMHSRLRSVQKSLKGREVALLWLKTSQSRGGYLEYWERGEFHSWVSENEEAALLYYLVIEVNGGVISTVDKWRALTRQHDPFVKNGIRFGPVTKGLENLPNGVKGPS